MCMVCIYVVIWAIITRGAGPIRNGSRHKNGGNRVVPYFLFVSLQ